MQRKRIAEASKGVGKPKVGGEFTLVDQNGNPFTSAMMKGKYSLVRHPVARGGYSHARLPPCLGGLD